LSAAACPEEELEGEDDEFGLAGVASCPKQGSAAKRKTATAMECEANFLWMVMDFGKAEGEALGPYRRGHVMQHLIRKL
ncbi:MAG: hypothetical protein WAN03_04540, partial [Candidatus Sulfotelmatobacter sp.]